MNLPTLSREVLQMKQQTQVTKDGENEEQPLPDDGEDSQMSDYSEADFSNLMST
jgi:hypothetical protein